MINSRVLSWSVWLLASIFYAYQFIIRVLPNILMPEIMQKFQIDAAIFGQFSGIYYIGYTLVHLPIGIMLDRIGPKYVLPACMLLTAIGLLPIVYSDTWVYPILGRFIIGLGSSGAILGAFKIVRLGFKEEQFTIMIGITVTIGLLGAIYGGRPLNILLTLFGWQSVLQAICYIGIALAIISFYLIPKSEKFLDSSSILKDIKDVTANSKVILVCILGGLMVGPLEGFADAWSTEFFRIAYQLDETTASTLPSFIFLGMCLGAPLLSYVAARTSRYYEMTILAAVTMMIGFILILFFSIPISLISILLSVVGFLCGYQILVIYKASSYVPENLVGLTTAFANMTIMTFGYFFHTIIGRVMDTYWTGTIEGSRRLYTPEAFQRGLLIIPLALAVASIGFIWVYLKENRKRIL